MIARSVDAVGDCEGLNFGSTHLHIGFPMKRRTFDVKELLLFGKALATHPASGKNLHKGGSPDNTTCSMCWHIPKKNPNEVLQLFLCY